MFCYRVSHSPRFSNTLAAARSALALASVAVALTVTDAGVVAREEEGEIARAEVVNDGGLRESKVNFPSAVSPFIPLNSVVQQRCVSGMSNLHKCIASSLSFCNEAAVAGNSAS